MPWTPRALPCSPPRLQVSPCPRRWPSVSQEVCSVLHEPRGCRGGFLLGRLWAWNYLGIHTKGDSERRSQPPPAPAWLQEGRGTLQAAILTCSCGHECMCRRVCLCRCVWCVQTCAQVHVGVQVCVQADVCECKHVCSRVCVVCKHVCMCKCVCVRQKERSVTRLGPWVQHPSWAPVGRACPSWAPRPSLDGPTLPCASDRHWVCSHMRPTAWPCRGQGPPVVTPEWAVLWCPAAVHVTLLAGPPPPQGMPSPAESCHDLRTRDEVVTCGHERPLCPWNTVAQPRAADCPHRKWVGVAEPSSQGRQKAWCGRYRLASALSGARPPRWEGTGQWSGNRCVCLSCRHVHVPAACQAGPHGRPACVVMMCVLEHPCV